MVITTLLEITLHKGMMMPIINNIINILIHGETLTQAKRRRKREASITKQNTEVDTLSALPSYKVISDIEEPIAKAKDLCTKRSDLRMCIQQHICIQCGNELSKKHSVVHCNTCKIRFSDQGNYY